MAESNSRIGTPIVERTTCARIPTVFGNYQLCHYTNDRDDKEHLALIMGDVTDQKDVLVRVHSECMTGDVFGSLRCDCGEQLEFAMQKIAEEGRGVIVYLRQEGRGIGLSQKLRAYNLQDEGYDTVDANLLLGHQADEREYWAAVGILSDLQIQSIRLLTNNPTKIEHLRDAGVSVVERVPVETSIHPENAAYLEAKVRRMRHMLRVPTSTPSTVAGTELSPVLQKRVESLHAQALAYAETTGLPFVTLSYAQSLDGSLAARSGESLQLSGSQAMVLTHALRSTHDAILVGIDTVLADDPQLTVRYVAGSTPQPVILDSHLRFPSNARLLAHPKGVWIASTTESGEQLTQLGDQVRILTLPPDGDGRVDLEALLRELARQGIRSLMVEGGARVLTAFLRCRLANSLVVTVAPRLVGGVPMLSPQPRYESLITQMPHLDAVDYVQAGEDLIVWGEPVWDERLTADA